MLFTFLFFQPYTLFFQNSKIPSLREGVIKVEMAARVHREIDKPGKVVGLLTVESSAMAHIKQGTIRITFPRDTFPKTNRSVFNFKTKTNKNRYIFGRYLKFCNILENQNKYSKGGYVPRSTFRNSAPGDSVFGFIIDFGLQGARAG